jgi:molybdopterin synthase sulfur carrier subunit
LVPGDTVRNVLHKVSAELPALQEKILDEDGELQSAISVLVNGRSIRFLEGLDSIVQEGDAFALFPAVGGG